MALHDCESASRCDRLTPIYGYPVVRIQGGLQRRSATERSEPSSGDGTPIFRSCSPYCMRQDVKAMEVLYTSLPYTSLIIVLVKQGLAFIADSKCRREDLLEKKIFIEFDFQFRDRCIPMKFVLTVQSGTVCYPLNTERRLLYLNAHFVPRSKHF